MGHAKGMRMLMPSSMATSDASKGSGRQLHPHSRLPLFHIACHAAFVCTVLLESIGGSIFRTEVAASQAE